MRCIEIKTFIVVQSAVEKIAYALVIVYCVSRRRGREKRVREPYFKVVSILVRLLDGAFLQNSYRVHNEVNSCRKNGDDNRNEHHDKLRADISVEQFVYQLHSTSLLNFPRTVSSPPNLFLSYRSPRSEKLQGQPLSLLRLPLSS